MIIGTGATNAKWLTATITAEAKCFAKVVFTRVALKNKVFLKFASTAEMKGVTNDTTILILPHYGGEMERIMGAILGSTTDQAVMAFLLLGIAKRHGIDVEFDFSNPYNPKVNFIGGTYEQHEALAMELAEKFEEV